MSDEKPSAPAPQGADPFARVKRIRLFGATDGHAGDLKEWVTLEDAEAVYRAAEVDEARAAQQAEMERLRAALEVATAARCPYETCAALEAKVIRLTQERDEQAEQAAGIARVSADHRAEIARLTAARAAQDQKIRSLVKQWLDTSYAMKMDIPAGSPREGDAYLAGKSGQMKWCADQLAALLAVKGTPR